MDTKDLQRIIVYIRKPQAILAIAIIVGLLLDLSVFSTKLLPRLTERHNAKEVASTVAKQKQTLQGQPLPTKATTADIEQLVKQVPTKDELPRFIIDVRNLESQTKVKLTSISFDGGANGTNEIATMMKEMFSPQAAQPAATADNGTAPQSATPAAPAANGQSAVNNGGKTGVAAGTQPSTGSQAATPPANPIAEHQVDLVVNGTYIQGLDFIRKLEQSERLVNIVKWQMSPNGKVDPTNVEDDKNSVVQLSFTISCKIYTAKGYAGKFADLPDIALPMIGDRVDPTLTDEQFWQLLQKSSRP
jgi:Tfp pilus assembly protein PilO